MKATTQEQRERLEQIRLANGGILRPADVVQDAAAEDSPLHELFEWNDSEAAAAYRLAQARSVIRNVTYELRIGEAVRTTVAYVRDPDADHGEQGYRSVEDLISEEEAAHRALVEEFRRVAALLARARNLAAVLGLEGEVDDILGRVSAAHIRIEHFAPAAVQ